MFTFNLLYPIEVFLYPIIYAYVRKSCYVTLKDNFNNYTIVLIIIVMKIPGPTISMSGLFAGSVKCILIYPLANPITSQYKILLNYVFSHVATKDIFNTIWIPRNLI